MTTWYRHSITDRSHDQSFVLVQIYMHRAHDHTHRSHDQSFLLVYTHTEHAITRFPDHMTIEAPSLEHITDHMTYMAIH